MPRIIRVTVDQTEGHSPATKTQAILGSEDVFIGVYNVVRMDDRYAPHQYADMVLLPHLSTAIATNTVYANNKQIQVDGDINSCGDTARSLGDHQVFIGGN